MVSEYVKLMAATLMSVVAAVVLFLIDKNTPFSKLNKSIKQIIFGIVFGGLAVIGTEWGVPINGAQVNCRDAAVLTAGLLFGGPSGIIAGLIGGIERWYAVNWGVGTFTQVACSVSTVVAGFYSAFLRKYLFEDKKPSFLLSLAIGIVMEIFHLTMVFVTNMNTPIKAMMVVKMCTIPMVFANALSVMIATMAITLISKEKLGSKHEYVRISQTVQRWMMITVAVAFFVTSGFVYILQNAISQNQANTLLTLGLEEISQDISDASAASLLQTTKVINEERKTKDLATLAKEYDVAEIHVVNKKGRIIDSSDKKYINFDMKEERQSAEFMCLLGQQTEYSQAYGPMAYDNSVWRKYVGIKCEEGFMQVGYNGEQLQRLTDSKVIGLSKNRTVGETGYILIVDGDFNVVSAPYNFRYDSVKGSMATDTELKTETMLTATIDRKECFCMYKEWEGYYLVSVYPKSEALETRNIALYVNTFMEILVFALLFGIIYLIIKKVIVNNIKKINQSLGKISSGNLNEVIDVRSNEEFASLSDDINSTVDTLKKYIKEASERIDKELEFAKNIQISSLPNVFPAFPKQTEFDIYARMDTAKEVGGDFYDFYMTDKNTINFLIADVSGKGIPAAMFMMRAKTELKTLTESGIEISEVFTNGNKALCEGNDAGMFVTAWQGTVNLKTGLMTFANAGHNPPLVKKKNGQFEYLKTRAGFVLAGMDIVKYKSQELQLEKGDTVFLYTDGVTEATNINNELYGEDRLLDILNSKEYDNVSEICDEVKKDVDKFVADAPQFDDITMVAFRYFGEKEYPSVHFDEAKIEDIPQVTEFAESELEKMDMPMKSVIQINVAIDEIYSNIAKFAYPNKKGPVTVTIGKLDAENCAFVQFVDEGLPYNPLTTNDPDITLSAEDREIGGLGIFMVKKTMDNLEYKYENDRNIFTIKKNIG